MVGGGCNVGPACRALLLIGGRYPQMWTGRQLFDGATVYLGGIGDGKVERGFS